MRDNRFLLFIILVFISIAAFAMLHYDYMAQAVIYKKAVYDIQHAQPGKTKNE